MNKYFKTLAVSGSLLAGLLVITSAANAAGLFHCAGQYEISALKKSRTNQPILVLAEGKFYAGNQSLALDLMETAMEARIDEMLIDQNIDADVVPKVARPIYCSEEKFLVKPIPSSKPVDREFALVTAKGACEIEALDVSGTKLRAFCVDIRHPQVELEHGIKVNAAKEYCRKNTSCVKVANGASDKVYYRK